MEPRYWTPEEVRRLLERAETAAALARDLREEWEQIIAEGRARRGEE